jgi:hypothetical protein
MTSVETELGAFHRRFLEMEDDLDLFALHVDGVRIWERIRTRVGIELVQELGLTGDVGQTGADSVREYLYGASLCARNLVSRNPFLASHHDLLYLGHPRRKLRDGHWWDIYCDPIHEATDFDYIHLEGVWNNRHYRPAQTERLRYVDLISLPGVFVHRLGVTLFDFSPDERRTAERIERRIRSTFDVEMDVETLVRRELNTRSMTKPGFDALLRRVSPELVVLVRSSGNETFIEACHDADVPVAELQHGQISPHSYQHAFPGNRTKEAYPDYLLTFGDFWAGAVSYPIDDDRIISVGYPYLEREVEKRADVESDDQVVFISTGETGPKLSKLAVELSERPDVTSDVVYKLHPDEYPQWQTEYPWLVDAPLRVVGETGPGLYELFARSRAQVGVGSTALYEGVAFGLNTYLVELPTVEWLAPLLDTEAATLVDSVDDLAAKLATVTAREIRHDQYFKPNAIENVTETITDLKATGTIAER